MVSVIDINLAYYDLTHYLLDISSTKWPIYKKCLTKRKIPIENYITAKVWKQLIRASIIVMTNNSVARHRNHLK